MDDNTRSTAISTTRIALTEELPILRLKQLCKQGLYSYRMIWDRFANGYMITCEVSYYVARKRRTLTKEVQWVETSDLHIAQNTVAAVLIHRLNLGTEAEDEEGEGEEEVQNESTVDPRTAMKWGTDMMKILLEPDTDCAPTEVAGAISGLISTLGPAISKTYADVLQDAQEGETNH